MLQRVTMSGIELPRLYIAENNKDAELAMSKGIPFIRWTRGQDELIKILLRPVLEKLFPHIKWSKVLGRKRTFKTNVIMAEPRSLTSEAEEDDIEDDVMDDNDIVGDDDIIDDGMSHEVMTDEDGTMVEDADIATGERVFDGGGQMTIVHKLDIKDYVGDLSSSVNLEVLQRLQLMPAFIGDILDCIKINIGSGMRWREGYNKRLGIPVGRFDTARQLPNLIILDVSGSIPRGISATMISLIDTLRTQLSADLIITSTSSRFYPMGSELPDPQRIRDMFGYGNESVDFMGILNKNIRGRHYGHVFSFGDDDTPGYWNIDLTGTVVEHVHHYHTGWSFDHGKTGYAKWCHMLAGRPLEDYDTSWCNIIKS